MRDEQVVDRADELIQKGERLLRTAQPSGGGMARGGRSKIPSAITGSSYVDSGLWSEWRSQALSFLRRTINNSGVYTDHFEHHTNSPQHSSVSRGIGVLKALREDVAGGHLVQYKELIHAEAFSDFLEQAEYLLSSGYKDSAAVLAGAVLEEQLRLLCGKNDIPTMVGEKPKKADTMNADLNKAGAYDTNQVKIVTGWLGIRNSAAHGKFDEYTADQVRQLISGVREFTARFPA